MMALAILPCLWRGVPVRAWSPAESEPHAKRVAELIAKVRTRKVRALFFENMSNPVLIEQIACDSGAIVGAKLYSDALSERGVPLRPTRP
jgi:ABC-type Zn uptake system ZnuABC Zn-binding protein ZnuA